MGRKYCQTDDLTSVRVCSLIQAEASYLIPAVTSNKMDLDFRDCFGRKNNNKNSIL